jgi:hypothetical protein
MQFKLCTISNLKSELIGRFFNRLFGGLIVTFFVTVRLPKTVVKNITLMDVILGFADASKAVAGVNIRARLS